VIPVQDFGAPQRKGRSSMPKISTRIAGSIGLAPAGSTHSKMLTTLNFRNSMKQFKSKLVVFSRQEKVLPDYGLAVIDPWRPFCLIDPQAPPLTGRTPLKAWMVYFYRRDKLAAAIPISVAPEISDSDL
jgi:hypothetical protein